MKRKNELALSSSKGFTLIELLVVIAIIGILSTIVMVSLNTARQKARDARRMSDMQQISVAMTMWRDSNAAYPTAAEFTGAFKTTYFPGGLPTDPSTGANYTYTPGTDTYCVYADLETDTYFYANQNGTGKNATAGCP